ncbi:MAG TPA: PEP-CTERM sorting domain-containing protein [Tepidisphaeraceae bacterium]|nr:PEP-CTERM sorting domain-containing protein [Tepidisphaeraceae bacterium]
MSTEIETDDRADAVEVDEQFHVRDDGSANWVVRKLAECRAYRERVARWAQAETLRAERQEAFLMHRFGDELEAWTREQIGKQHGRRRSIALPAGVLGFRREPSKLLVFDEEALVGAAMAWGYGGEGQLGYGSTGNSSTRVQVSGLTSGVTAIAAGGWHSLAIQNGAAMAWGQGTQGQLGNGLIGNSSTRVQVSGLTSGVTAIAGGAHHSLAIQDGDVFAWGYNAGGRLGDGTSTTSSTPLKVLDLAVNLLDVAATDSSSYALSADGSLWVWGYNINGQLGLGDTTTRFTPTQLFAPAGYKFTSIDGGANGVHAVATIAVVPEPTSLALLGLGGLALLRRRGRGRRQG